MQATFQLALSYQYFGKDLSSDILVLSFEVQEDPLTRSRLSSCLQYSPPKGLLPNSHGIISCLFLTFFQVFF